MALERATAPRGGKVTIAVPRLARIANFDDFDPLRLEPDVSLVMVAPGEPLPVCDLVILPGSKATIADLAFFRAQGWDIDLPAHVRRGGRVLGLCGGYQMLGQTIADRRGWRAGRQGRGPGAARRRNTMQGDKALVAVRGTSRQRRRPSSVTKCISGRTDGPAARARCCALRTGVAMARISPDGLVMGAYAHGLFADEVRSAQRGSRWLGARLKPRL